MGGRGGYGGKNHPANYSSVRRAMENATIVTDVLQYYAGEKLKRTGYYIKMLEDAINKEAFNQGYEITISEVNTMVDELLKVKSSAAKETSEEEKKTAEAIEYFRSHYNPNREPREITSSTYKRAQKRMDKQMKLWMKGH